MRAVASPQDFDGHSLAEFVEASLLASKDDFLSIAELRGLFMSGSKPTDLQLEDALTEVERRANQFGSLYPFTVVDRGFQISRREDNALYEFLLLLSLRGTPLRATGQYERSDAIFDEIVRVAFKNHLGVGSDAIVFGWPARGARPNVFSLAVAWAAQRMGIEMRTRKIPDEYKDAGVDVLAWKPFADGKNGFPIVLVQNTVQFDFRQKPRDVSPSQWHAWLEVGATPRIGFAVPFALPARDPWWDHAGIDVDTMMDRGRLMSQLETENVAAWPSWGEVLTFVAEETLSSVNSDEDVTVVRPRKQSRSKLMEREGAGG